MAKLKCMHDRRVLVIEKSQVTKVLHRNDGTRCDSQYVSIATVVFEPKPLGGTVELDTARNALGPVVGIGKPADIAEKIAKKITQKKVRQHARKRAEK